MPNERETEGALYCRLFGHSRAAKTRALHDPDALDERGIDNDLLEICDRCGVVLDG